MLRSVCFLVAGWVLLSSAPLLAQDAVLGQIYGNGVHAYFGQDYLKAHQLFTSAIDGHSQDPRCFYFRGLTLLKLGRPQDAEIDFQHGAKLESSADAVRAYNVARSLERVQGSDRGTLEQYRLEARMAVLKKAEDENVRRYQQGVKELRENLQRQSEGGPAKSVEAPDGAKSVEVPVDAGKAAGTVPAASHPPDPFSEDSKAGDVKKGDAGASAAPVEPAKIEAEKPDATKPAGGATEVFGGTVVKPGAPAAGGVTLPVVPAAGGAKPDAADLFGDAGGAKPVAPAAGGAAKPATPAAGGAKPDASDPFGDAGGAKPVAPAAGGAAKPAVPAAGGAKPDASDPFGDAGGAAKPAASAPAGSSFAEEPDKSPAKKPAAAPADDKTPADAAKKPAADKKPPDDKKSSGEDPFG